MSKKIQLTIPTPCHENWDAMLPADKGRFCQSCSKEVIDFTMMSDTQLVAFFKKPSAGSLCGRFMDDQLDRQIAEPRKQLPWVKYFFQFALPAFLISMKASSQTSAMQGKIVAEQPVKTKGKPVIQKTTLKAVVIPEIKGRVVDEKGLPIPYSSVIVKGTTRGVAADSSGYFSIKTQAEDGLVTLLISSVGYAPSEKIIELYDSMPAVLITLNTKNLQEVAVYASFCGRKMGGLAGGVVISSNSFSIIKDTLAIFSSKFSLYPNPITVGSFITLRNKTLSDDLYEIEMVNASGQLVNKTQAQISGKQSTTLNIPAVTPGVYFIKLTGRKKGKTYSEKLIIR